MYDINDNKIKIVDEDIESSPILDFYSGKTVFLTGVTGFLGQCFLVKLLRIGVKSVYILIRDRKNKSPQERFEKLIESPIFQSLRKERPNFANHIIPVSGSLDEIELNISADDQTNLFKNVEIIIHSAADIRFDVPLKTVAFRNVRGTRELLRLGQKMKNFVNFVYISTAYSFCFKDVTKEQFYNPPLDSEEIIKIAESMKSETDVDILNTICKKIIKPWPNTYTFSKAITENLVREHRKYFNITIVRPSIVTATYREPIEGWNTNYSGLNGILCGVSAGVLRTMELRGKCAVDTVCCDFVINAALAATYNVSTTSDTITPVFNVISGNDFTVIIDEIIKRMVGYRSDSIPIRALWYPFLIPGRNRFTFFIMSVFLHAIPAILIDTLMKIKGKKERIMKIYRQVHMFSDILNLFSNNTFKFENKNMKRICSNMTFKDKEIFPCDFGSLFNWDEYMDIYFYKGIVKCLLKETPDREKMRKHSRKLFFIHHSFVIIFISCVVYAACLIAKKFFEILNI